jgi:TonB family protein
VRNIALFILFLASAPSASSSPVAPNLPNGSIDCRHFYPRDTPIGFKGKTLIAVRRTKDGTMKEPRILNSSGSGALDKAATACVIATHMAPTTRNGVAIETELAFEIDWPRAVAYPALPDCVKNICAHGDRP